MFATPTAPKLMNSQLIPKQPPVSSVCLPAIYETAKTRWFKTAEIYYILTNVMTLASAGLPLSPNSELHTPPSIIFCAFV